MKRSITKNSKISQKIKGYNRMNNSRGMKRQTIKIKNQWV